MKIRVFKTLMAASAAIVLTASAASAVMTGGLASPPGAGEFTLSMMLGYLQHDVEDGVDDEAASRKLTVKGDFGLADFADFYVFVGLGDISYQEHSFDGSLGEVFGAGVRYSPTPFRDGSRFVLDVQGEYSTSDDGKLESDRLAYHLAAYMVGNFGSSGGLGYFFPYAGLRLSTVKYSNKGFDDYDAADHVGAFAGADYFVNPNVYFSGEFHLFDESSVYLCAGYRF